jgi:hypothetical protein
LAIGAGPGLFLILVSKAPALVWEAQMTGTGKLGQLKPKDPWPYVNNHNSYLISDVTGERLSPDLKILDFAGKMVHPGSWNAWNPLVATN